MNITKVLEEKLYTTNEYGYVYQDLHAKLSEQEIIELKKVYNLTTEFVDPKTGSKMPVHNMCINCQARQFLKYRSHKGESGDSLKDFNVNCSFVPAGLPQGSRKLLNQLAAEKEMDMDRALLYLKSSIDPVAWLELMFGFSDGDPDWRIREYQKEQIRCTSNRVVLRMGRRSGKSFGMACKLIYMLFNTVLQRGVNGEGKPIYVGPQILIITPFQAQIDNLFNEMEKLIKRNEYLKEQISTGTAGSLYVKSPYFRMETKAGGRISGFVSGIGSREDGSGGGVLRGQGADIIYLDEMDMIPEDIMDRVVLPIIATTPNVILIATSTPIGKRAKFYNYCLMRPDYKEDYYPSTVLPHWDKIKGDIEAENTGEAFASEFMAHFIEGSYGVFKPSLVYEAMGAYTYADSDLSNIRWWSKNAGVKDRTDLMTVIGIDWNKNAGSEFVVVVYDPNQHHWWVAEAVNVSAGEYSSVKFKEEVIRLNYKWKPDYIYADEGYGHHIIEDLQLEGHRLRVKENPNKIEVETAKLVDRLKAFNFSQKVTLRSPIDQVEFDKTGKEFLVENTIRVFEEKRIWFPEEDKVLKDQLLNYVILRRHASNNKPVYGPSSDRIGDHRLDALMLALAGLFLEKSLYSPNTGADSRPGLLTRVMLEQRAKNFNTGVSAMDLVKKLQNVHMSSMVFSIQGDRSPESRKLLGQEQKTGREQFLAAKKRGDFMSREPESAYSVLESRMKQQKGYDDDTEHLYQKEPSSSFGVIRKRGSRDRSLTRRSRG